MVLLFLHWSGLLSSFNMFWYTFVNYLIPILILSSPVKCQHALAIMNVAVMLLFRIPKVFHGSILFHTLLHASRRDSLWQRLTAGLREEERQKLPREQVSCVPSLTTAHTTHIDHCITHVTCVPLLQVLGGLSFTELSELLDLVSVENLGAVDPQLLPLLSKPLHWYQGLIRVLQSKYQERHR